MGTRFVGRHRSTRCSVGSPHHGRSSTAASDESGAVVPAPRAQAKQKPFVVTMVAKKKNVGVGTKVLLKGKVTPTSKKTPGRIEINRYQGGRFVVVARPKIETDGTLRYRAYVSTPGANKFRAYRLWDGKHSIVYSKVVTVQGWRWRYLSKMESLYTSRWDEGTVVIAGKTYPKSYSSDDWADDEDPSEFNLDGKCTRLRGTAGLRNESDSKAKRNLSVERDGVEVLSTNFTSLAATTSLGLNIAGTLRVSFTQADLTDDWYDGYVCLGNAAVYCRS